MQVNRTAMADRDAIIKSKKRKEKLAKEDLKMKPDHDSDVLGLVCESGFLSIRDFATLLCCGKHLPNNKTLMHKIRPLLKKVFNVRSVPNDHVKTSQILRKLVRYPTYNISIYREKKHERVSA